MQLLFCLVLLAASAGLAERVSNKMFEHFDGRAACFRRLNGTHQIGCTSRRGGSVGVIHFVSGRKDIDFLARNGTAGPYILVMPTDLFGTETMQELVAWGEEMLAGVVLYTEQLRPKHFTHDSTCPNRDSNIPGSCDTSWNPYGSGLLWADIPFPVFHVGNASEVAQIEQCYRRFNQHDFPGQKYRSLCSLELDGFMNAALDSRTCLRRSKLGLHFSYLKHCDPLGDRNVWASLFPANTTTTTTTKRKWIVLAARADTTSLFNDLHPGAASPVTGLVAQLATAAFLKRMLPHDSDTYKKNVLFVIFNGEAYDYIGSQRLVYEMQNGEFPMEKDDAIKHPIEPIKLEDVDLYVELAELMKVDKISAHFVRDAYGQNSEKVRDFIAKMSGKVGVEPVVGPLPPASFQTFIRERVTGVVLADHKAAYSSPYFNSIYDDAENIGYQYQQAQVPPDGSLQAFTAGVALQLARALHQEVTGQTDNSTEPTDDQKILVDELFNCYLLNPNCRLHQASTLKKAITNETLPLYVSVNVKYNVITTLTGLTLAWLMHDEVPLKKEDCIGNYHEPVYQYFWMSSSMDDINKTVCMRTTMNFSLALSPAFTLPNYDWSSGRYSTWTESTWEELAIRMFLKPSQQHELLTILLGVAVFGLSFLLVYLAKRKACTLFPKAEVIVPANC